MPTVNKFSMTSSANVYAYLLHMQLPSIFIYIFFHEKELVAMLIFFLFFENRLPLTIEACFLLFMYFSPFVILFYGI